MLVLATLLLAPHLLQGDDAVRPREASWSELSGGYLKADRLLPYPDSTELLEGERRIVDLMTELDGLCRLRLEPNGEWAGWCQSFGDLVAAFGAVRRDAKRTEELLESLAEAAPDSYRLLEPYLPELVRQDALYEKGWDPSDDEPNDGLLFAEPWRISDTAVRSSYWRDVSGDREVYQVAVLIYADMRAIKEAESDFRKYLERVGNRFEVIYPLTDSYLAGSDEDGRDYSFLRVFYRSDLPFPFSSYDCTLSILNRFDERGRLVAEIYGEGEDLHWMAGRDLFLPIEDGDGEWVAYLLIRHIGLDIAGVPDGDSQRQDAMRGFLGNLKLQAEELYAARGKPDALDGKVPRVAATGAR